MISKYPRTYHLTLSKGCTNDDKMLENNDRFIGNEVVITSKLDGSNFCMTSEECFARSHSGPPTHKSFNWAKAFHNQVKYLIPNNIAIYAECLFAKHSIHYTSLPHYLCIFNILDMESNTWLSWDQVEQYSLELEIPTVPVLFRGKIENQNKLQELYSVLMNQKEFDADEREGIVIRVSESFHNDDFTVSMGKAVRANHVQTSEHWKNQEIVKNKLKV